jgi:hypothetical protein
MNKALRFAPRPSIADVLYPKDAIVVCRDCGKPLYRLQASISAHESVPRSTWKYAPVSVADLKALMERQDLEPGLRAAIKAMSVDDQRLHCERIPDLKPNASAECPACGHDFVFGQIHDDADGKARFGDKSFTIKLAFIPPFGRSRVSA